ncbi:hypothetical protein [Undibacterium luofuense]|uniref:Uncharacterized protein n=1 Tax=Undibacterium luofuense TaxID=2828733 RepID=A0A941I754_9BURK|nr:hypothetical protein [Undibacterium luofuense]MBR7781493.1 hypothetical protein [Undibacterium luofuense]
MLIQLRRFTEFSLTLCLLFNLTSVRADSDDTIHVRYYQGGTVPEYAVRVLTLALQKSGHSYSLTPVTTPMTTPRIVRTIRNNTPDSVNLFWAASSPDLENALAAIPVPIERGLIGFRVLVTSQEYLPRIEQMNNDHNFKTINLLQGIGWSDTAILRKNGFTVTEASPDNLYNMLAAGRADAFPRSAIDAERELRTQQKLHPSLTIAPGIALVYPRFGVFFFVSGDNKPLRIALEKGMQAALKDGSFLKLYEEDPDIRSALKMLRDPRKIYKLSGTSPDSALHKLDANLFEPLLSGVSKENAAANTRK